MNNKEAKQEIEDSKKEQFMLNKFLSAKENNDSVTLAAAEVRSMDKLINRLVVNTDRAESLCIEVARMLSYFVMEAVRANARTDAVMADTLDADEALDAVQDEFGFYFCPDCDGLGCQRCDYEGVIYR